MKQDGKPCPDRFTLRLGRAGRPSPPAFYKYRGRTREWGDKREEGYWFLRTEDEKQRVLRRERDLKKKTETKRRFWRSEK
jgi:hypothetical protein